MCGKRVKVYLIVQGEEMRNWLKTGLLCAALFAVAVNVKAEEKVKIGLSLPTQSEERWVMDKVTMEKTAKELGVELLVQVSHNSQAQQNNQVDQLISQGAQVIIFTPHDGDAAAIAAEKAEKEGVKVLAYDRLITNAPLSGFFMFDSVKIGEMQGQYLVDHAPKGNYILLSGSPTDSNSALYKQGAMNILQPLIDKGDIKVVMDQAVIDWQPANAQKIVENALTKANNDIQGILAPNDGTAGGAIAALEAQGLAGKVIVTGMDAEVAAAQRIAKGTQSMTSFTDIRVMASEAVKAAAKIAKGEEVAWNGSENNGRMAVPTMLVDATSVDKANLDAMLIDSGYMKKEDVYK